MVQKHRVFACNFGMALYYRCLLRPFFSPALSLKLCKAKALHLLFYFILKSLKSQIKYRCILCEEKWIQKTDDPNETDI